MAFLPERVFPLCEDEDREMVLRLHPVMDEQGLARLPPPPHPGGPRGRRPDLQPSHPQLATGKLICDLQLQASEENLQYGFIVSLLLLLWKCDV